MPEITHTHTDTHTHIHTNIHTDRNRIYTDIHTHTVLYPSHFLFLFFTDTFFSLSFILFLLKQIGKKLSVKRICFFTSEKNKFGKENDLYMYLPIN